MCVARGRGADLRDAFDAFGAFLRDDLGPALNSEDLVQRRQYLDNQLEEQVRRISRPFEEELAESQLSLVQVKMGKGVRQVVLPVIDGEPTPPEKLRQMRLDESLSNQQFEELERTHWWFRGRRSVYFGLLEHHLDGHRPERVLDLGCGMGGFLDGLSELGDRVFPADVSVASPTYK